MLKNVMKLFRDLMKLGSVETEGGILIYEGSTIEVGTEVFVEVDGEIIPAPDGEYGDYTVEAGKVSAIKNEEPADEEEDTDEEVTEEVVENEEVTDEEDEKETESEDSEDTEASGDDSTEDGTEDEEEEDDDETNDYEERIKALEDKVAELTALIEEMSAKQAEAFSMIKPAAKEVKDTQTTKKGAAKYFA